MADKKSAADRIITVSMWVLLVAIFCGFIANLPRPTNVPPREVGPPIEVTAQQIADEFRDNEITAARKYHHPDLRITGKIGRIRETVTGKPTLEFHPDGGPIIRCEFSNPADLSGLKTGDEIAVSGRAKGKFIDLLVDNCRIEK